ncbi:hypothetical protein [Alteribacillus sp. YIM 98480]|uniref:hypothetical protein n=1 Tax=Alteribacillus sp. YIM 98480 TaxID=2606599 RepID=UPI00131ECEF3|nr:hypothetical protein [Alteribacillus sp. YIM 98480]
MSSASAYSLEIPSVRPWKTKILQDLSLVSKAFARFLKVISNFTLYWIIGSPCHEIYKVW